MEGLVDDGVSGVIGLPRTDIFYLTTHDHNYHDESSGQGVFRSSDGGANWLAVNSGLAVLRFNGLEVSPGPSPLVYLASGGSGVYVGVDPAFASSFPEKN